MKVLLDEMLPIGVRQPLPEHQVMTAAYVGLAGVSNGRNHQSGHQRRSAPSRAVHCGLISTRQVERGEGSHDDRAGDGIQRDRLRARARAAGPFVWWLLISWWASGIGVAWAALVMIIGIQVAIWLINRLPTVLTLRPRRQSWTLGQDKFGRSVVIEHRREQVPWPLRGLWFVFVGRWASAVWMGIARLIQLTIIGIPITILMFNRTPFIASLYRY